jgi:hypothetical protein
MKKKEEQKLPPDSLNVCRIPLAPGERGQVPAPAKLQDITWRIFRIMAEFVEGFEFLSKFQNEVTIFGSARYLPGQHWYHEARKLGNLLAQHKFTVITGGGPGIMEAANRGAYEKNGESVGINIQLPKEQRINPYVKSGRAFYYFFTRKVMLAASAQAYVFFPGGYGTMDELFEMLTLIQTKKSERVTVVLVGKDFWSPLVSWMHEHFAEREKTIDPEDLSLFNLVDSAEEAFAHIRHTKERTFF